MPEPPLTLEGVVEVTGDLSADQLTAGLRSLCTDSVDISVGSTLFTQRFCLTLRNDGLPSDPMAEGEQQQFEDMVRASLTEAVAAVLAVPEQEITVVNATAGMTTATVDVGVEYTVGDRLLAMDARLLIRDRQRGNRQASAVAPLLAGASPAERTAFRAQLAATYSSQANQSRHVLPLEGLQVGLSSECGGPPLLTRIGFRVRSIDGPVPMAGLLLPPEHGDGHGEPAAVRVNTSALLQSLLAAGITGVHVADERVVDELPEPGPEPELEPEPEPEPDPAQEPGPEPNNDPTPVSEPDDTPSGTGEPVPASTAGGAPIPSEAGGGGGAILGVLAAVAGIGAVGGYCWYTARSHRRDRTYEIELSPDNSPDKPLSTAEQAKLKREKGRRLAMMLYGSRARVMWQP